ncbi:MAG: hypothetical protein ABSF56_01275 [Minisyncoccia bacterium]|jgi:hypothetical protein
MKSISEFFENIRTRQARTARLCTVVQGAVEEHAHIPVQLEAISFSGRTAVIRGLDQTAKSVVFVKKTAILAEIGAKLGDRSVVDIRLAA